MQTLPNSAVFSLPVLTPVAVVDILVTAFLIYQFLMIIRGRRAMHVLFGVFVLVLTYLLALLIGMAMLETLLATLAPYTAFALIVMFQSEIRRMLARIGPRGLLPWGSRIQQREFMEEIMLALEDLSARKRGALIVIEREIGLRTFIESGVRLDAAVSHDLLLSIFQPGGALHDGAVIIQNGRIAAAACFLPLSMNPVLMSTLGTRHRAAIGVTEETDCIALVVSEETGRISIAAFGELEMDVSLQRVDQRLARHLGGHETRAKHPSVHPSQQRPAQQPASQRATSRSEP